MLEPQDPEVLRRFLDEYSAYTREVLKPTLARIRELFDRWTDNEYWSTTRPATRLPAPSPIEHRWSRIKRPESVVDKILRKPDVFRNGLTLDSVRQMNDAVAGRVTVYFLSNIPLIHREIMKTPEIEIVDQPVAYLDDDLLSRLALPEVRRGTKDSGYSSVHYTLRFRKLDGLDAERPLWELQVRTLAEHLWAQVHHILGYKGQKKTNFAVTRTFQIMSWHLRAIDESFNLLFQELTRFQVETRNLGDDDLLNAENLPAVLDEIGTGCSQREIDGLLRMLNSRGLATIGRLRMAGTARNIETIHNTFRAHKGRSPSNFEVVASLAAVAGIQNEQKLVEAVRTQIDFLEAWEQAKKDF